ncbi:MAG: hypothetical protein HY318_19910 [Armatimonadetes bacterium]|nr:hypothetical protein [Armatimonadota bacterium]
MHNHRFLKLIVTGMLIGLTGWTVLSANGENILRDPGFENSPIGGLKVWNGDLWAINGGYPGKAEVIAARDQARTGERFLRLEFEKGPGLQNDFMIVFDVFRYPANHGTKHTLKLWVRGEGETAVGVQRYDKSGKWIPPHADQATDFLPVKSPGEWKEISFSYLPKRDDNALMFNISARGKIDVDDASLDITELTAEELKENELKQKKAAQPPVETRAEPAASLSGQGNPNDILNGGFENWTVMDSVPKTWDVAGKFIPERWGIEDRPDEKGRLCRIINSRDDSGDASFGKYSLLLNGRLVSQYVYDNVKDKRFQVSLMARGHGGNVVVRLREYTGPTNSRYVIHDMEIINTSTGAEWRRYTAKAVVPSTSGGPLPTGASLEIIGKDVVIDNVQSELSEATRQYSPIIYAVPVSSDKVVIDGDFSEQEWSNASGANIGFVDEGGNLVKRQAEYYLSADGANLLICLRTPFAGALKQQVRERDGNVWEDDSYEIHINPSPGQKTPPVAYQFIINALGAVYDARYNNGVRMAASKDWICEGLKVASKCRDNVWTVEIAFPLAEIGLQPGKEFGLNLCKNLKNPDEFSNLTGHGYFDYDKMVLVRTDKYTPSVFWGSIGAIGEDNLNLFARVSNNGAQKQSCEISFSADAEKVTKNEKREVTLPPSAQETAYFNTGKNPGEFGEIGLTAENGADKTAIVAHRMNYEASALLEQETTGNKIAYYPTQNKIGVVLAASQIEKVAKVEVTVKRNGILIQKTSTDRIEISEDKKGQAMVNFAPSGEGTYLVSAVALDGGGNCLGYIADDVVVRKFAWLNNDCGKGKTINRPFIPLSKSGRTMSCWGRKYTFAGSGLPEQIMSQDEKVLAAPIAFAWMDGSSVRYGKNGVFKLTEFSDQSASFTGETVFENFRIIARCKLEYDGTIFYDFDLAPKRGASIPNLHFEIPFRNLKYFTAPNGSLAELSMCRHPEEGEYIDSSVPVWTPDYMYIPKGARMHNSLYFPKGNGTIWTSRHISNPTIQGDFLPYLTFGNTRCGMCWFADNDRGWRRDSARPSYEIAREGISSKVKIHLVSRPLKPSNAGRISFALAATPVRPRKTGFNYLNWSVMGFGESSFIEGYCGGLTVKDNFLLGKYLAAIDQNGERPVLFYVTKANLTLGDPVVRYFHNEWQRIPESSYNNRATMPTKKYGVNPDDYVGPACCLYSEAVDYRAFRIDQLIKNNPRLRGIYWDENYSHPCQDVFHKNCGYRLEDGTVQAGSQFYAMRELDKRVQAILQKHDRPFPNLLVHNSGILIPPLYSFADIDLRGERGTKNQDFIDYWTLPALEYIGAGAWGINTMWITQAMDNPTLANNRALLAALKLFDFNIWNPYCMQELVAKFRETENKFGISENDSRFFGYWQKGNNQAVSGLPVSVKASFFVRPGKGALLYVSNLDRSKQTVQAKLDFSRWNINHLRVTDAETGREIKLDGNTVSLDIDRHDFRNLVIDQMQ